MFRGVWQWDVCMADKAFPSKIADIVYVLMPNTSCTIFHLHKNNYYNGECEGKRCSICNFCQFQHRFNERCTRQRKALVYSFVRGKITSLLHIALCSLGVNIVKALHLQVSGCSDNYLQPSSNTFLGKTVQMGWVFDDVMMTENTFSRCAVEIVNAGINPGKCNIGLFYSTFHTVHILCLVNFRSHTVISNFKS